MDVLALVTKPAPAAFVLLLAAVTACAPAGGGEEVGEDIAPVVRPTTFVVAATPGDDVRVDAAQLVFRRAGHEDLLARHAGDVLACSGGEGFLRKVKAVRAAGDDVILVDTLPAGLGDALSQGRIHDRIATSEADTKSLYPLGVGGALLRLPFSGRVPMGSTGAIDVEEGHLAFDPDVDVDFAVKDGTLSSARFVVSGKADASLRAKLDIHRPSHVVDGTLFRLGEPGWKLASAPPIRRVVMVGWLPVVVSVRLDLYLEYLVELSGDVSGEIDLDVSSALRGGVELTAGEWRGIGEGSFDLGHQNGVVVSRRVFGGDLVLSTRLSVQVYEAAGPFLTFDAYGGVASEHAGDLGDVYGRLGIRSRAGVEASLFGATLGYQVALFDRSTRIPFSVSSPSP